MKHRFWILACLLAVVAVGWFWPRGSALSFRAPAQPSAAARLTAPNLNLTARNLAPAGIPGAGSSATNRNGRFAFRLANTPKTIGQLTSDPHAILLANAFIETDLKTPLSIPTHLRATGEPGAYMVQARGVITAAFRAAVAGAGGQIVSYLPNNAYLVQLTAAAAAGLAGNALVQAVLPYEPYYKVQTSLLAAAVNQQPLPAGTTLTLGLYSSGAAATETQITQLGGKIVGRDRSPFGPVVRVQPPADWLALAQLPGVQIVEPARERKPANDLSRPTIGMSPTYFSSVAYDYLGLTGSNVLVAVIDSGIDATHPDLTNRVLLGSTNANTDTSGHGTHVAGILAGDGTKSTTATYEAGVALVGQPNQYRGKARKATLYSVNYNDVYDTYYDYFYYYSSDQFLQEAAGRTNALISNNSWNYDYSSEYDLAAASYDAAVRDAVPEMTGPQPVLFVFSAGNDGGGNDNGVGGYADSILSPATGKNVITVGALEQYRNVTNTYLPYGSVNPVAAWAAETDSSNQVASYSSCGNVGIGTEGTYGRFKPDVVAPGTFVVSTRSQQWDTNAYYNATYSHEYAVPPNQYVATNLYQSYTMAVPANATAISFQIQANGLSPSPFPKLKIVVSTNSSPNPTNAASYDFATTNNAVNIPTPDGGSNYLQAAIANGYLYFAVADTTTNSVQYTLVENVTTLNDYGNYQTVFEDLNNQLGPYYRYESGTSMAAPAVAGVLALMQDYFTNHLALTPSPALLKALLINGSRVAWPGVYGYAISGGVNEEGWGLINLPNSLPQSLTNSTGAATPLFFVDQNPTNLLATGDSRTYTVTALNNLPLRITLAWTDPPGNPAAATKLVNSLQLMVTNLTTHQVYYGNNFDTSAQPLSIPYATNNTPVFDTINNVQNIVIANAQGNYSVTVVGQSVNVNAVTTGQTNTAQDYALVIANDDNGNYPGVNVTAPVSASSPNPQVSVIAGGNQIGFYQTVGANAPLVNTNFIYFGTNAAGFATNAVFYLGVTNQWHFYVATNTTGYTNAAFVVFDPYTLSLARESVFDDWYDWYYSYYGNADANPVGADLDIFVAADPGLTNLNTQVLSNCISGTNGYSAMLDRGGTAYVAFTNSTLNQVYYIGVKCESQLGAQYGFVGAFSQNPFSTLDADGNEYVNAFNVPVTIPDGDNAHPGVGYVMGLALYPITVRNVVVSNTVTHQNFGDLLGILTHNETYATLNNHDSYGSVTNQTLVYDDSYFINPSNVNSLIINSNLNATNSSSITNVLKSDGPGGLTYFNNKDGTGLWMLTEIDDSPTQTGQVDNLTLKIEPHNPGTNGLEVYVYGESWIFDYIYVPPGFTNLTVVATNLSGGSTPPVQLQLQPPTGNIITVNLDQGSPYPGNSISYGPPLPPGYYFVGIYNPNLTGVDVFWNYTLTYDPAAILKADYSSTDTPLPIADDALTVSPMAMANYGYTNSTIFVPDDNSIVGVNVGLRVDHPRISDLTFTLIDPYGFRYLLMENRGSDSTNGCGAAGIAITTGGGSPTGGATPYTNVIVTATNYGTITINYNMYSIPDTMVVYNGTNFLWTSGLVSGTNSVTLTYTNANITILMNPGGGQSGTAWYYNYTATGVRSYYYLDFTEDPSLTTTPIKFAPVPFIPDPSGPPTNIYYQAEQSLAPLIGESTYGYWQLEVLDNRAGATNPPPSLVSWQLEFEYANPNYTNYYPQLLGFTPQTNTLTSENIQWYQVYVPTNATFATNILDYASAPVILWYAVTYPASAISLLLPDSSFPNGTNGSYIMDTFSTSPLLVPGRVYYLGVENINSFTVTNVIEVDFDHGNPAPYPQSVHFNSVKVNSSSAQLSWDTAAGSHYQVQWKDSLTAPWNTVTNPVTTSSNGLSTFTDTGAQTAPLGGQRYYRLVWVP